jgi:hypothetical protein
MEPNPNTQLADFEYYEEEEELLPGNEDPVAKKQTNGNAVKVDV